MSLTTKRALAESLKKLLARRSLDKITVKDIVDDCGVNRQTFYYHFHDIYDLVEWIFRDAAQTLSGQKLDYDNWGTGLEVLLEYMLDNRILILNAYNSISHEVVSDYIKEFLRPFAERVVRTQAGNMATPGNEEDLKFVVDLVTLMASGFTMEWVGRRMQDKFLTEHIRKLQIALDGSVTLMLNNLEQDRRCRGKE